MPRICARFLGEIKRGECAVFSPNFQPSLAVPLSEKSWGKARKISGSRGESFRLISSEIPTENHVFKALRWANFWAIFQPISCCCRGLRSSKKE